MKHTRQVFPHESTIHLSHSWHGTAGRRLHKALYLSQPGPGACSRRRIHSVVGPRHSARHWSLLVRFSFRSFLGRRHKHFRELWRWRCIWHGAKELLPIDVHESDLCDVPLEKAAQHLRGLRWSDAVDSMSGEMRGNIGIARQDAYFSKGAPVD